MHGDYYLRATQSPRSLLASLQGGSSAALAQPCQKNNQRINRERDVLPLQFCSTCEGTNSLLFLHAFAVSYFSFVRTMVIFRTASWGRVNEGHPLAKYAETQSPNGNQLQYISRYNASQSKRGTNYNDNMWLGFNYLRHRYPTLWVVQPLSQIFPRSSRGGNGSLDFATRSRLGRLKREKRRRAAWLDINWQISHAARVAACAALERINSTPARWHTPYLTGGTMTVVVVTRRDYFRLRASSEKLIQTTRRISSVSPACWIFSGASMSSCPPRSGEALKRFAHKEMQKGANATRCPMDTTSPTPIHTANPHTTKGQHISQIVGTISFSRRDRSTTPVVDLFHRQTWSPKLENVE